MRTSLFPCGNSVKFRLTLSTLMIWVYICDPVAFEDSLEIFTCLEPFKTQLRSRAQQKPSVLGDFNYFRTRNPLRLIRIHSSDPLEM